MSFTPQEQNRLLTTLFDPSPLAKVFGKMADAGFALAHRWSPEWSETPPDHWKTLPRRTRFVASIAAYCGDVRIWLNRRRADRKGRS